MKKTYLILLVVLVALTFTGCATVKTPLEGTGITTQLVKRDYEVLGKVDYQGKVTNICGVYTHGGAMYKEMFAQAKAQYPECDEVINITTDTISKTILLVYNTYTYVMTGTAIAYK